MTQPIARWESSRGTHWVELTTFVPSVGPLAGRKTYGYSSNQSGGGLHALDDDDSAVQELQRRVDSGLFLPDAAKRPMKRKY